MMFQANATLAVITDDPQLHDRVRHLFAGLDAPEIHCMGHQGEVLSPGAAPNLIVVALPRDQIHDLAATLDMLANDATLAHLPLLVYVPEAEQAELMEVCVGGETDVIPERSSRGETDRSLDDGLPGGREDL
jgi:hypothetical protein